MYNQSLFLALSVASLYCMRRGRWWYAGVLAGLASATRQAGVLLALAFVVEYLRQREWRIERIRWNAAAIALVPSGLVAFMVYSAIALDDPLKFMHVQIYWGREASLPWTGSVKASEQLGDAAADGFVFQPLVVLNVIDMLAVLVTGGLLVLSVVGPWRLGQESWYLIAVAAASFLIVLISPIGRGCHRCTACHGTCWRSCRRSSCWPASGRTDISTASTSCPRWGFRASWCSRSSTASGSPEPSRRTK